MLLFPNYDITSKSTATIKDIEGLSYVPEFITIQEHNFLWNAINKEVWRDDLKRRVQHYGYIYDYKTRSIKREMYLGPLPEWSIQIATKLVEHGFFSNLPDQVIVNEYEPGQGIADHIDCLPCFTDTIVSLSLGSQCVMNIINERDKTKHLDLVLNPRSLVVLKDAARYNWTHGIKPTKTDTIEGNKVPRSKRISLTFRKVILSV